MNSGGQLESLQAVCPGAAEKHEVGYHFVYLPQLKVPVGDELRVMDALLALTNPSGYVTRLYLAEQITERPTIDGQPANWTLHQILGRNWWTWSWQGVEASLPWIQILLAHMKALK